MFDHGSMLPRAALALVLDDPNSTVESFVRWKVMREPSVAISFRLRTMWNMSWKRRESPISVLSSELAVAVPPSRIVTLEMFA